MLEKMGYKDPVVTKRDGAWTAVASDPLNQIEVRFEPLGTTVDAAILALHKYSPVPKHYVCGHWTTCKQCGVVDKPMGYTESASGNFMHRCRSCASVWVAMTAAEQEEQAEAWMNEAQEVHDPLFKRFSKGG